MDKTNNKVSAAYLGNFCSEGSDSIYAIDKAAGTAEKIAADCAAHEKYMYAIDQDDAFTMVTNELLSRFEKAAAEEAASHDEDKKDTDEPEDIFAEEAAEIIGKASKLTPWEIDNCFIMNGVKKKLWCALIAGQHMRSPKFRKNVLTFLDQQKAVIAEKMAKNEIEKGDIDEKLSQIVPVLYEQKHKELIELLYTLDWNIYINKTNVKLMTSDSPVIFIRHESEAADATGGAASPGVEVIFPLSDKVMIVCYDGVNKDFKSNSNMGYMAVAYENVINLYNQHIFYSAEKYVFSSDQPELGK